MYNVWVGGNRFLFLKSLQKSNYSIQEMPHGIQIVDFRLMFTMPFDFLTQFAESQGKRLRLLSPYKEKLSHAFGHFFSRVGLPQDIPPF